MSTQEERFAQIAAAIREKDGTTDPIKALDFAARILAIPTGGGASDFAIPLIVTVDPGATVAATHGETTITATSGADGTAILILTAPGVWNVTAALGDKEKTAQVEVAEGYDVKISLASRLPGGYVEVEYIASSGVQWIDSGYIPNGQTEIECKFFPLTTDTNASFAVFGQRADNGSLATLFYKAPNYIANYNSGYPQFSAETVPFVNMEVECRYGGYSCTLFAGGKNFEIPLGNQSFQGACTLGLFTCHQPSMNILPASIRMYLCNIYANGTIPVRNFVPCINPSGAVGLFDLVESKFYANAGTGTFIAGPAV